MEPAPTIRDTAGFYADDYMTKNRMGGIARRLVNFLEWREARTLVGRAQNGSILDYGCGDGAFVRALHRIGARDAWGFEPMARTGKHQATIVGDLGDLEGMDKRFDLIRLHDVIEHLVDVDATMTRIARLLAPGGAVVGITPDGAHAGSRVFGKWWGFLHFPYHTTCFSSRGLRIAATRWGFAAVTLERVFSSSAWAFTAEHFVKAATGSQQRGHLPIYPALMLATAPLAVIDSLTPGDTSAYAFTLTSSA